MEAYAYSLAAGARRTMEGFQLARAAAVPGRSPSGRPMTRAYARGRIRLRPRPPNLGATGVQGWFNPNTRRQRILSVLAAIVSGGVTLYGVSVYSARNLINYLQSYGHPPPANTSLALVHTKVMAFAKRRWRPVARPRRYRRKAGRMFKRRSLYWRRRGGMTGRSTFTGWGPLQKKMRYRAIRRPLNLNFKRNDYDSCRDLFQTNVLQPSVTGEVFNNYNFIVSDSAIAASKLFDYDEYRCDNIQLVLESNKAPMGNDANISTDDAEDSLYGFIIPRVHTPSITAATYEDFLRTPGVIKFHLLSRKKIVVNLSPTYAPVGEHIFSNQAGTAHDIRRPLKKMGWIHNPQTAGPIVATNYFNYGNCFIYLPKLAAGSYIPRWNVRIYATAKFRGNRRAQIDV